MGYKSKLKQ